MLPIRVLLASVLASSLVALGGCAPLAEDRPQRPVVLTTFTVLADIARHVAGDRLEVESITKPGAEIHHYEPTPGDLIRGLDAALVIENGLGLEAWFAKFLEDVRAPGVTLGDAVEPVAIRGGEGDGLVNPHAWMSPASGIAYVDRLVDAFAELDPEGAEVYAANGAAYREELLAVAEEMSIGLAALPSEHRVLATCEGAFSYLARDAELEEAYLWPINAEGEATPQQVAVLVEQVRGRGVPAVFCESTVPDGAMRQVAEQTGARFGGTLYVDSLSDDDGPVPTYLQLLRYDAQTIVSGLSGSTRA